MISLKSTKKYSLLLAFTLLMSTIAAVASVTIVAPVSAQADEWPQFRHDPAHIAYSTSAMPSTLKIKWTFKTGAEARGSPSVANGKVFCGSDDGYFYCLDANTGSVNWKYKTGLTVTSCGAAIVAGKVYFGSTDKNVYCLDENTGSLVWKYATGGFVYSSPVVADGRVIINSNDAFTYCLDPNDGSLIWKHQTGSMLITTWYSSSPAIAGANVYVASQNSYIYCLDAATGTQVWNHSIGTQVLFSSPTIANGKLYIGGDNMYAYCLNATTGNQVWNWTLPPRGTPGGMISVTSIESSPAVYGGLFYLGFPHRMVCLDAETGEKKWISNTGSLMKSSAAVADGKVYIGCDDTYFYVFDAVSGTRLQSIRLSQASMLRSAIAVVDGKVYVGSCDDSIYCLDAGTHTTITNWVSPSTLKLGESVNVGGGILPAVSGVTVTINYTKYGAGAKTVTRTVTTATDGTYADSYTPDVEGSWRVQASWAGSATHDAAKSIYSTIYVKAAAAITSTTITCSVSPTSITRGDSITVSGSISPAVSGATVTLTYTMPNGTTLTRTVTSGTDGSFTDTYTPDMEGDWSVKSSWPGSATHAASTSTAATLTVTAPAPAAIPIEYIYGIAAVIVIAIIAIAAYWYMRRKK